MYRIESNDKIGLMMYDDDGKLIYQRISNYEVWYNSKGLVAYEKYTDSVAPDHAFEYDENNRVVREKCNGIEKIIEYTEDNIIEHFLSDKTEITIIKDKNGNYINIEYRNKEYIGE